MAIENPYAAPNSIVSDPITSDSISRVPEEILKKIRYAWIAALFSAGLTLVVTLIAMSGTKILGFSAWELLDVVFILGLAFGIYMKNRACAVIMLIYFIASKIILMVEAGQPSGLPMAIAFGYLYWQGVAGTFAYHAFLKPN